MSEIKRTKYVQVSWLLSVAILCTRVVISLTNHLHGNIVRYYTAKLQTRVVS